MGGLTLRDAWVAQLRERLEARRWDYDRVAERAGLHPRTVRRLFTGQSFSLSTVERVARALGADTSGPQTPQDAAGNRNTPRVTAALSPVVGWKAASVVLQVSEDTLCRYRRRARDAHRPWWPSPEALSEWWLGVLAGSNSDRPNGTHTCSASESRSGSERSGDDRNADDPGAR